MTASFESYFYTVAMSICAFTAAVACDRRRRVGLLPGFFIAYLLLESLGFVFELLIHSPGAPAKSLWLAMVVWSSYLVAPCMWLFAREISTAERPSLSGLHWGHLAVIGVGLVLVLPRISIAHLGTDYAPADRVIGPDTWLFINAMELLCVIVFAVQVPYYWWKSFLILTRGPDGSRRQFLNPPANRYFSALRLVLVAVATNWVVSLLRTVHCVVLGGPTTYSLVLTGIEVAVSIVALALILRKSEPGHGETETAGSHQRALPRESGEKYARSGLDGERRRHIVDKIRRAMEADQLFRDNALTLGSLCEHIGEKTHYVSQVLNQDLGISFFDLVNRYRVDCAKLVLGREPARPMVDIAEAVGFNAKSTFNTAFRKHAGMTPSQYRSQYRA